MKSVALCFMAICSHDFVAVEKSPLHQNPRSGPDRDIGANA
jgi:hypothetical protein